MGIKMNEKHMHCNRIQNDTVILVNSQKDMSYVLVLQIKYKLNRSCQNINIKKIKLMTVDNIDSDVRAVIKIGNNRN